MKTNAEFKKWLKSKGACADGFKSVGEQTPQEFYKTCHRSDWLMWWFFRATNDGIQGYPTIDQYKKIALEIARKSLQFTKDENVKKGLDLIEDYLTTGNDNSLKEGRTILTTARTEARKNWRAAAYAAAAADAAAAAAADAAAAAADAAAAAAADAAAAAAYVAVANAYAAAAAADAAAAYAAAAAAYAAADAAYAAADAAATAAADDAAAAAYAAADDADAAARTKMRKECADIIRTVCGELTF